MRLSKPTRASSRIIGGTSSGSPSSSVTTGRIGSSMWRECFCTPRQEPSTRVEKRRRRVGSSGSSRSLRCDDSRGWLAKRPSAKRCKLPPRSIGYGLEAVPVENDAVAWLAWRDRAALLDAQRLGDIAIVPPAQCSPGARLRGASKIWGRTFLRDPAAGPPRTRAGLSDYRLRESP